MVVLNTIKNTQNLKDSEAKTTKDTVTKDANNIKDDHQKSGSIKIDKSESTHICYTTKRKKLITGIIT